MYTQLGHPPSLRSFWVTCLSFLCVLLTFDRNARLARILAQLHASIGNQHERVVLVYMVNWICLVFDLLT